MRLAIAARADLGNIRSYSKAVFGAKAAVDYVNGLRATAHRAGARPLLGMIEPALGEGMRSIGFRSHRVYYRYDGDDVLIVRILHHAQDVRTAFDTPS